jgi:hypothetical protein
MIRQNIQNFKLGSLQRTKVTASSGLALLMTFAKDIGLGKQLDLRFSHLKLRQRGYSVSAKILSFLQMIIKGGDRLSDTDLSFAGRSGLVESFADCDRRSSCARQSEGLHTFSFSPGSKIIACRHSRHHVTAKAVI